MHYFTTCGSPLGPITLACDGESLTGLWMEGQKYHGNIALGTMIPKDDFAVFDAAKQWLSKYFVGEKPDASLLPLAPVGGDFRRAVWKILLEIPYGQVTTYGEIAKKLAAQTNRESMSAQAIGGAVGHNPISIIIPCHRVVGAKGNLTGYAGGIDKKVKLLELEGADMSRLFVPQKGTAL